VTSRLFDERSKVLTIVEGWKTTFIASPQQTTDEYKQNKSLKYHRYKSRGKDKGKRGFV